MQTHSINRSETFTGALIVFTTVFLLGYSVEYSAQFFAAVTLFLLPRQLVTYYRRKLHYYLVELCYCTTFFFSLFILGISPMATLVPVWSLPHVAEYRSQIWRIMFALANGPLLSSGVLFGDIVDITALKHITGTYIHIVSALVSYNLRWRENIYDSLLDKEATVSFYTWVLTGICGYLCWLVPYCIFIVVTSKRVTPEHDTLFKLMMSWAGFSEERINSLTLRQYLYYFTCYISLHMCASILNICLTYYLYYNYYANTLVVVGASVYVLFRTAKYYSKRLQVLQKTQ
jgi:Protein of unknown function (DUF2838)